MVEDADSRQDKDKDRKKAGKAGRAASVVIALTLLLLLAGSGLWFVLHTQANAGQNASIQVKQMQDTATFPLYAPKTLPPDFEMIEDSVFTRENLVSFSLQYKT